MRHFHKNFAAADPRRPRTQGPARRPSTWLETWVHETVQTLSDPKGVWRGSPHSGLRSEGHSPPIPDHRPPAQPLDNAELSYYHIRMGTHVCGAEPRSRNHRNQPTAKGAHRGGAPAPGTVPQLYRNCSGSVPHLFHKCPTFVPRNRTLSYEMEQNGTVWDSFRQNPRPRPSDAIALRRLTLAESLAGQPSRSLRARRFSPLAGSLGRRGGVDDQVGLFPPLWQGVWGLCPQFPNGRAGGDDQPFVRTTMIERPRLRLRVCLVLPSGQTL